MKTKTPEDRFLESVKVSIAEFHSALLSQKIKRRLALKKAKQNRGK